MARAILADGSEVEFVDGAWVPVPFAEAGSPAATVYAISPTTRTGVIHSHLSHFGSNN